MEYKTKELIYLLFYIPYLKDIVLNMEYKTKDKLILFYYHILGCIVFVCSMVSIFLCLYVYRSSSLLWIAVNTPNMCVTLILGLHTYSLIANIINLKYRQIY